MWKMRRKRANLQERLDKVLLGDFEPPIEIIQPDILAAPLILASPHSGRRYPQSFLSQTTLGLNDLRKVEDAYIDTIFKPLSAPHNIAFIRALFPRSVIDPNRSADELPPYSQLPVPYPRVISPNARAGLGVVPTRINIEQDIYPQSLSDTLIARRIETLYRPYHTALQGLLESAQSQFGHALLLDCHSMPGRGPNGAPRPDFILGDRYGEACYKQTITRLESSLRALGYNTARNHPYAGGYITKHYGKPKQGVEAIQIEINKDIYLNAATLQPHSGMKPLMKNMEKVVLHMGEYLLENIDIAAQ